jgi:hypothetical protein
MKKLILLTCTLCLVQFIFSQSNSGAPVSTGQRNAERGTRTKGNVNSATNGDSWKDGTIAYDDAKGQLSLDTTFLSKGPLQVVVISSKPDDFKFRRDKFEITSTRDFKLDYSVKRNFQAGHATMTLYMYSGKLIVFKKEYSVMFDGKLNPIVTPG